MKIAFINGNPFWGGAEKWHVGAAQYLRGRGHEVHFYAGSEEVAQRLREAGVPVSVHGFKSDVDPLTFGALLRAFRKSKPQAVIMNSDRDMRAGGAAAALAGIKVRVHRKGISGLKNNPRYRWTYRNLRTHTLCVAHAIKEEIEKLGWVPSDSLKVIHSGVDLEKFSPEGSGNLRNELGLGKEDVLIGAVARISSIKGFEYLIEAIPEVLKVHPNTRCVLVGTGRIEGELKDKVEKLGLNQSVTFVGFREDSPDAIRSLDIVVHPSVHTEGLPNSLLEAMACGKPVIATPVAGIPEALQEDETGILVPSRDSKALAQAIISMMNKDDMRLSMSKAARVRAEKCFNQADKMAQLASWLEQLVSD